MSEDFMLNDDLNLITDFNSTYQIVEINNDISNYSTERNLAYFPHNQQINIRQYLPEYLNDKNSEIYKFISGMEYVWNNLYEGVAGVKHDYKKVDYFDYLIEYNVIQNTTDETLNDDDNWQNVEDDVDNGMIQNVPLDLIDTDYDEKDLELGDLYEYKEEVIPKNNIGILEKINRIHSIKHPQLTPENSIYKIAENIGYDDNLKLLNVATEDNKDNITFLLDSLPYWYSQKITEKGLKQILFVAQETGNIEPIYSKDYTNNWETISVGIDGNNKIYDDYDLFIDENEENEKYFPTPHFNFTTNLNFLDIDFVENDITDEIQNRLMNNTIESNSYTNIMDNMRPVNTVSSGKKTKWKANAFSDQIGYIDAIPSSKQEVNCYGLITNDNSKI